MFRHPTGHPSDIHCPRDEAGDARSPAFRRKPAGKPPEGGPGNGLFPAADAVERQVSQVLALVVWLAVAMPSVYAQGGNTSPAAPGSDHSAATPSPDAIERAKQAFYEGPNSPKRAEAAKVLYPLIKVGMTRSDVLLLLRVPDASKGGQLMRFFDYSVGKGQAIEIEFDPETDA